MKRLCLVHSAFCILGSVVIGLAGCQGNHLTQPNDPFLGPAPPRPVAPSSGGGATARAGEGSVPPLPGSTTVPSQAALASGTTQTPENPRSLRMDTPPVLPVSSPGGAVRGVSPGGVQVEGPIPVPDSTSNLAPVPIAQGGLQQTGASAPATTWEQMQQMLKQRGVVWQRLDCDRGQWKFQCSIPLPGQTGINRTYETKTPLPQDPVSAIRAVLDAIDKDQRQ